MEVVGRSGEVANTAPQTPPVSFDPVDVGASFLPVRALPPVIGVRQYQGCVALALSSLEGGAKCVYEFSPS